ncbi:MAG TPA: TonB-dependent receptor [Saprospiraceae bacterium]|nr:TonB-dependent receptor [Saprospiraceae bacterium]
MKQLFLLPIFFLLALAGAFAQNQTIKGQILDKQSEMPLIGATVVWLGGDGQNGAVTDGDGFFKLENIPVGRQAFQISYIGYNNLTVPNVVVTAGKEVVLNLALEESIEQLDEVVVTAAAEKDKAQNELATVSARQFSLEEVNRYSGGRSDVARLVGNFAGVSTPNDSRNDIVIRGNSPTGVLWRLEGTPIPNPNHFSTFGTTGGPVSALNPNLMRNSDFLTSAFPAEYGNALAGVFDLGFRNGNRDKHEYTVQLAAVSGLELMAEGPVAGGSYIVAGRYSFVGFAKDLGLPIGTNATPNYSDLAFKLDFANGKAGKFTLFGIGGMSDIDFLHDEVDEEDLFSQPDEDSYAVSKFGVAGLRHNLILDENTYLRTVLSASTSQNQFDNDRYYDLGSESERLLRLVEVDNKEYRATFSTYLNKKFNARLTGRAGFLIEEYFYNLNTRSRDNEPDRDGDGEPDWRTAYQFDEHTPLLQAFVQTQYKISPKWTLNTGLHAQYLDLNETFALEPRVAVNWNFAPSNTLTLGYGMHQQVQPLPLLLLESVNDAGETLRSNFDLGFTRSQHMVLGYDVKLGNDWRGKAELYYQAVDNVPVESTSGSFSILNVGADFAFPDDKVNLVNEGTGNNYGLELTLEKFFSRGYYALVTASVYDSNYKGSDGVERNTAFNNGYVFNVLAGKEIKIGKDKRHALTFDTKLTTAGGRYYTPVDLELSQMAGQEVPDEARAFSEQYDPYFRWDVKFGVRLNSKKRKLSHQFYFDIQNVTNNENIFARRYNRRTNAVNEVYQIGFFPDFMYRVQF